MNHNLIQHPSRHTMQLHHPKSVRFAEEASLRIYPTPSKKSTQQLWYTKQEMESFKIAIRNETLSLRKWNANEVIESFLNAITSPGKKLPHSIIESFHENLLEMRGIEHIVSLKVLNLMLTKRKMAISHVIREQNTQNFLGIRHERRLAEASMRCTQFSKMWSSQIALARAV